MEVQNFAGTLIMPHIEYPLNDVKSAFSFVFRQIEAREWEI